MFVSRSLCVYSFILLLYERHLKQITSENVFAHIPSPDQQTSVTTIRLFNNSSQVRYPIRHVRYFYSQTVSNASFIYSKAFCDLATISLQACQQTTALLKEFTGLFTLKSLAQVKLRDDRITSCGYLRFAFTFSTSCGFLRLGF